MGEGYLWDWEENYLHTGIKGDDGMTLHGWGGELIWLL